MLGYVQTLPRDNAARRIGNTAEHALAISMREMEEEEEEEETFWVDYSKPSYESRINSESWSIFIPSLYVHPFKNFFQKFSIFTIYLYSNLSKSYLDIINKYLNVSI